MRSQWAELEVTRACNLRCKTCLFACNDALENELTTAEIKSLIDQFVQAGARWLKLTGGEPLLRQDIFEIIDYAKKKDLKVRLNTNCTLITKDIADHLGKLGLDLVQVSIDGFEKNNDDLRGKGTFKKTIEAMHFLVKNGIRVDSNTIVTQKNKGELLALCDMLSYMGVQSIGFSRLISTCRSKEVYSELLLSTPELMLVKMKLMTLAMYKKYDISFYNGFAYYVRSCGYSFTNPFIMSDGKITPCCSMRHVVIGNIRESSYSHVVRKLKEARFTTPGTLFGDCNTCRNRLSATKNWSKQ